MSTQTEKLDCVFQFPDGTRHAAQAHLFWHKYAGRVFWYGVAQFPETSIPLPDEIVVGSVTFDDGRVGRAAFRDGRVGPGGYFEVGFVGLDQLGVPSPSRKKRASEPNPEPKPEDGE
ncbi:MAG TPA: hypothetical protein VKD90_16885 [Gemmataceae bacterium]|nr:hypothetical protein [Gemmataceae bacterium]